MFVTKEQVDWAIGILDTVGDGEDVDGDVFFRANALLTTVAYAALALDKVWVVMFNDRRTGDFGVDRVFTSHEAALRYTIPKVAEMLGEDVGDVQAMTVEVMTELYTRLNDEMETLDIDSPYGVQQFWITEKALE